jgi:hypothetical protein
MLGAHGNTNASVKIMLRMQVDSFIAMQNNDLLFLQTYYDPHYDQ